MNNHTYKMLVLDLDDTLLTDDHKISIENKEALIKAQERGVYVVLASGRPTPAMLRYAEELELKKYGSFLVSYNGAIITDMASGETLFEQTLTKEEVHDLHSFSQDHKVDIITYVDGTIISERPSEYIDVEIGLTQMPHRIVPSFKDAVKTNMVKCIMLEEPTYLKSVADRLKAEKTDKSVSISKPFFLEVTPQGIDKAASIARLAQRLNIDQKEIIAVGNAGNDLSMVEYAGLGVWVDNVDEALRDKADVIVSSNNDHGVSEVVYNYLLK
ncbi:Cof-type HAD-IIB family hydrolase [Halosquirtibacter xylanolyticus]|uniref:Cof-type HAD-IIB family hydrolase n=1 Tax=Halosquirtibacter xylanolyticus TaxID=3374599 RepID=UPI0037488F33|nr:Cof-type HAD-IIB family hydrolase [Prolixibacteraceae bacterium]